MPTICARLSLPRGGANNDRKDHSGQCRYRAHVEVIRWRIQQILSRNMPSYGSPERSLGGETIGRCEVSQKSSPYRKTGQLVATCLPFASSSLGLETSWRRLRLCRFEHKR